MKAVAVGDAASGKTSLLLKYTTKSFSEEYVPTVFEMYTYLHPACSVFLWDTAGAEDYDKLRPVSYPNTEIFLLCFSVVCPRSFQNVSDKWVPEIRQHCPDIPILLVGTMVDLRSNTSKVSSMLKTNSVPVTKEQGEELAKTLNLEKYVECSSVTGEGVNDVFEQALLLRKTVEGPEHTSRAQGRSAAGQKCTLQ